MKLFNYLIIYFIATSLRSGGEGREVLNQMRQKIVDNFQERMQLRRSLIELEDQNVQNSIEVFIDSFFLIYFNFLIFLIFIIYLFIYI